MKKHLLGFCVALLTFFASFYISPIRFNSLGVGHGATTDGADWCSFSIQDSTHFVQLYAGSCDYQTAEKAKESINKNTNEAVEIIESVKEIELQNGRKIHRAIIKLEKNDLRYYCIIRSDENWIDDICSTSHRLILEFEQQKFKK